MSLARFIPSRLRDVLDPYRDLTYNVLAYGAVGDGSTNDTSAIQAAIDAAHASGGGIVYFPYTGSAYIVNGTLNLDDYNNIILRGEVTKRNQYASALAGVFLKRASGTGTMLHWAAVTAPQSLSGWGIEDLSFDGNSLAATGLYLSDLYGGKMKNIEVRGCTTVNVDLVGGAVGALGWQANTVDGLSIRARIGSEIGMRWDSASPYGGNVSLNTFKNVFIYHRDGTGLEVGDADSNTSYGMLIQAGGSPVGSGTGVLLKASNTTNARHARHNVWFGIQPSSGVGAQGTASGTQPSVNNAMYVITGNSVPDPTIGVGATLSWVLDQQNWPLKGVGTKTSNYTAVAGELVLCSTSGGGFTITLPDTPPLGTLIGVLISSGSNTLTIAASGTNTIFPGNVTSLSMVSAGENLLLEYVGADHWFAVSHGAVAPTAGSVTNSMLANMAAKTVKMRHTNSTGAPEDTTMANLWADLSAQAGADVDMNAHKLTNGAVGSAATDFATLSNRLSDFSIPNADLDLNTHKITRSAAATANGDLVRYEQVLPWTLIGSLKDVQVFTANGTWSKAAGLAAGGTYAVIFIKGAAGGGGGGSAGVSGTSRSGGAGGGTGGWVAFAVMLGALGSTATVTVGTGGAGGTAGNAGSNGSATTQFDTVTGNCTTPASVTAGGGGGAGGTGTSTAGAAGTATAPVYTGYQVTSTAQSGGAGGTCAAGADGAAGTVGSGGAGGGFHSTGPTFHSGGAGNVAAQTGTLTGGGGTSDAQKGAPSLAAHLAIPNATVLSGGGGGAGSVLAGGGAGGSASSGGGGGGGGSCITGNGTAGTGGNGGSGFVMVFVY